MSASTLPACSRCATTLPASPQSAAVGYGRDSSGLVVCYACCADDDLAVLRSSDRWTAYLAPQRDAIIGTIWTVSNWPGSLKMPAFNVRRSRAACFGRSIDREDFNCNGEIDNWLCEAVPAEKSADLDRLFRISAYLRHREERNRSWYYESQGQALLSL